MGLTVALYTSQLAPDATTGVHRYVAEIGRSLHERHPGRYRMYASAEDREPTLYPGGMPIVHLPGPRRLLHLSWLAIHRPRFERWAPDAHLVHVLHPSFPVPTKKPLIYTFHDLFPFTNPEWYRPRDAYFFKAAARDAADSAARVIAVSTYVADDLTRILGIEPARIEVIPSGVGEEFRTAPSDDRVREAAVHLGVEPGGYLLYAGAVNDRKNVPTVVRAIERRGPGAPLIIAGPLGKGAEVVSAEIERLGLEQRVVVAGYVADLPALMAGAIAFVFPSKNEGFGFPPLEAMSLGTPALVSRSGALPEVTGDAAVLLDPDEEDAWAEAMSQMEKDPEHRAAFAEKGKRHALTYEWERAARATAAVHDSVLGSSARGDRPRY